MILSLIRWLRGTVTFIIRGAFPERLISCCQRKGITVWNVKPKADGLSADSYAANYKKLRKCAKNSSVKIRIIEKRGAFVLLHRHRKRKGVIIGIVAAIALIVFCSTRVWNIEVSGCSDELCNAVIYQLRQNGVAIGCAKSKIDVKDLQKSLMLEDKRIAWIAINIVGSTAFIEVSETKDPPETIDPSEKVANIVAACDGQIKYLEVYDGQPMVKVGETVSKGDIIVSGIMEDKYGKKQMKYARAKVIARVNEEITVKVPLEQTVWQQCGSGRQKWYLSMDDKLLPISFGKVPSGAYSVEEDKRSMLFFDIIKKTYTPQIQQQIKMTEKQAKEFAVKQLDQHDVDHDSQKIISRSRKAQLLNGMYTVTERRELERDIAKTVEIEWIK